jgi:hypothetical protein
MKNLMRLVTKKGQREGRISVNDVSQDHRAFRTVAGNQESELEQNPHHESGSRALERVHDRRRKRTREIDDALARLVVLMGLQTSGRGMPCENSRS